MDKLKNISRSDLHFYKKVMSKYKKGKKNLLYLPMMIFRKNMSYVLSKIINAKFKLQLHFHKQSLLFSLITTTLNFAHDAELSKSLSCRLVRHPSFRNPESIRDRQAGITINAQELMTLYMLTKNIQGVNTLLGVKRHILQLLHRPALVKSFETVNIRRDLSKQKETSWKYYSVLEHKSSVIPSENNILLTNKTSLYTSRHLLNNIYQNLGAFINHVNRRKRAELDSNSVLLPKRHLLKEPDSFYFQENRKIEQAIEQIKKIAEKAKETVIKNSVPGYSSEKKDINQHFDIDRISDQVYKMIDHKLKIEKERRGYL